MNTLWCKITCLVAATTLSLASADPDNPLLRANSPKMLMVSQGDKLSLFCESEDPFDYCEWKNLDTLARCNLASNDMDNALECKMSAKKFTWDVTPNRCGIYVEQASREDAGRYQCYMFAGNSSNSVYHLSEVDVAVPALVTFSGIFNTDSEVKVRSGEVQVIECQAMGGYPAAHLRASLGHEKNEISTDPKADYILDEISAEEITNPDGTVDVKKKFTLPIQSHDCGKYVKCEASQTDKSGGELFSRRGKIVESRKLMVLFAPEPLFNPLPPFVFGLAESAKSVKVQFAANPAPANNQAIWHVNPTGQVGPDSIVLQAGTSYKDKYVAAPLNASGHTVEAVLTIKNPGELDATFQYFLDVSTDVGAQKYDFVLQYRPQNSLIETEFDPEERTDEATEDTSGLGIGIVIGIVVLVILVLGAIAAVIWMRSNKKFCFAEGTPKTTGGGSNPADGVDQAEKGEAAEPGERDNLKNNGV